MTITIISKMIDEEDLVETPPGGYTNEQKIVSAVWVHEKDYNCQSWKDIKNNFLARFNLPPPSRKTLLTWEKKLFTSGNVNDRERSSGRSAMRLMHVPYVKDSLRDAPDLSIRERAKLLGLPRATLLRIIRDDLDMQYEVEEDESCTNGVNRRYAGGGVWKKREEKKPELTSELTTQQQEGTSCNTDNIVINN